MKKIQSITILASILALVVVVSPIEVSAAEGKKGLNAVNVKVVGINQEGDPIPDIDITIDQPQLPDTQRGIEKSDIRRGMRSVQNETTDITIDQPRGREMVMPGDNVTVTAKLIVPVALNKGLRFAIREGEAMFEEDDEDMLEKSRIEKQEGTITIMKRLPDHPLNVIEHRMKKGTVKFFNETKGFKDELSNGVNLVYIGTGVLRTTDVTGEIFLSEGREMVMPGDNVLVGEKRKDYSSIDNAPEEKERGIGKDMDCDGDGYDDLACHTVGAGVVAEIVMGIDGTPKTPAISIAKETIEFRSGMDSGIRKAMGRLKCSDVTLERAAACEAFPKEWTLPAIDRDEDGSVTLKISTPKGPIRVIKEIKL